MFERRRPGGDAARVGQLFILGLPRSGTTLLYQYVVHRKKVAYFTNGVGEKPFEPCRTTWREITSQPPYRSDFASSFGSSTGTVAPSEAGSFWLRFFDIDAYETLRSVNMRDMRALARTIHCIEGLFGGAPFVNKNVKHMLRLEVLGKIFPKAHFLVIERQRQDVALSLLRARLKVQGDYAAWYSVRPDSYERLLDLPPEAQVCEQLARLEERMNQDFSRMDSGRVHRIIYDDFCSNPDSVFRLVPDILAGLDDVNPAIDRFEVAHSVPGNAIEQRLVDLLARQSET